MVKANSRLECWFVHFSWLHLWRRRPAQREHCQAKAFRLGGRLQVLALEYLGCGLLLPMRSASSQYCLVVESGALKASAILLALAPARAGYPGDPAQPHRPVWGKAASEALVNAANLGRAARPSTSVVITRGEHGSLGARCRLN